jgi:orotate phosphoribosyltransferase
LPSSDYDIIKNYIQNNCITYGDFTLSSGKKSNYYFDVKRAFYDPEIITKISNLLLQRIFRCNVYHTVKRNSPYINTISGIELGSVPLIGSMESVYCYFESAYKYNFCIVRKPKGYGTNKLVEGNDITNKNRVVLIDDVLTTGKSILNAKNIIENYGAKVELVMVVVDRQEVGGEDLEDRGIYVDSLFKMEDFIKKEI